MSRYARKVDATQKPLAKKLAEHGWYLVDLSRVGQGIPDMLCIKGSRHVWVEFKSAASVRYRKGALDTKTRERQAKVHDALRAAGAEVTVVMSEADLAQFERPEGARVRVESLR